MEDKEELIVKIIGLGNNTYNPNQYSQRESSSNVMMGGIEGLQRIKEAETLNIMNMDMRQSREEEDHFHRMDTMRDLMGILMKQSSEQEDQADNHSKVIL